MHPLFLYAASKSLRAVTDVFRTVSRETLLSMEPVFEASMYPEAKMEKRIYQILAAGIGEKAWSALGGILPGDLCHLATQTRTAEETRQALSASPVDIVIINSPLPDCSGVELALELAESTMGILLLTKPEQYESISAKVEDRGILTLSRPVSAKALYTAVKLLIAVTARLSRMEKKNQSLQDKMTDIRRVDRAKWLLIQHHNMTEQDAHYYIERQAMDTRLSRREIADSIIRTYDK